MSSPAFFAQLDGFLQDRGVRYFRAKEINPVGKKAGRVALKEAPRHLWENAVHTLHVLDWLRDDTDAPLFVSSGYRDPDYNRAVGGASRSMHTAFNAFDVSSRAHSPFVLATRLLTHPLAAEMGVGLYETFVHVDTRGLLGKPAPRRWGTPKGWYRP